MQVRISSFLKSKLPELNFFWCEVREAKVMPSSRKLIEIFEKEKVELLNNLSLEGLKKERNIIQTRRAFKVLGLDPARYRPSQEALIRRLLLNKEITFINNAVDLVNLLSIKYKLAMGIYDGDKVRGELIIREANPKEEFLAINERVVNCRKKIVLADSQGVIGSPYVDSQRTKVTEESKNLIHVIYLVPSDVKEEDFTEAKELFSEFLGAKIEGYYKVKEEQ